MLQSNRTLFRPVGLFEMELILKSDLRAFPPRLSEQPIFYPVLNYEYAVQIARDWNTKDERSGYSGFVTAFKVDEEHLERFEEHTVGASQHRELWIPSEKLDEFNRHIRDRIQFRGAFYGKRYKGLKHHFQDWYAEEMFARLYQTSLNSAQDFSGEVTLNRNAILLNFKYWIQRDLSEHVLYAGEQQRFLRHLAELWTHKFPDIPLVGVDLLNDTDS